jgi:hypothetical protein
LKLAKYSHIEALINPITAGGTNRQTTESKIMTPTLKLLLGTTATAILMAGAATVSAQEAQAPEVVETEIVETLESTEMVQEVEVIATEEAAETVETEATVETITIVETEETAETIPASEETVIPAEEAKPDSNE